MRIFFVYLGLIAFVCLAQDTDKTLERREMLLFHPSRLVVHFKQGVSIAAGPGRSALSSEPSLQALFDTNHLQVKRNLGSSLGMKNVYLIEASGASIAETQGYSVADTNLNSIMDQLGRNRYVSTVEFDYQVHISDLPNDPDLNRCWGLDCNTMPDTDIGAKEAWALETGSPNVIVAVIDSGVDYNHEDLAANMWRNPGETGLDGSGNDKEDNGIDDDGNGWIDDVYGIDTSNNDSDPFDDHSHGTHCAGIIGAVGNNGKGVCGVNQRVSIMALKFLSASGSGYTSDAVTLVEYAVAKGAHIMSNSWGNEGYSSALDQAIQLAGDAGVLFVAAAGNYSRDNDITTFYPAGYEQPNILSVASITQSDQLSSSSNFGLTTVDIAAPGSSIYSTTPGNTYGYKSGTSMATPFVAGVAALVLAAHPTFTHTELKSLLLETAESTAALAGKVVCGGRVHAYYALTQNTAPSVHFLAPAVNSIILSGSVTLTADVLDQEGIENVFFYSDTTLIQTLDQAPYTIQWDSTVFNDGEHQLNVEVVDLGGRVDSDTLRVYVNNSEDPGVFLYQPEPGTVGGLVGLKASASYGPGIEKVSFFINDEWVADVAQAPYEWFWPSYDRVNGNYTLKAMARGTDGSSTAHETLVITHNTFLPENERVALEAFFNQTNGDQWINNSGWKRSDGSFNTGLEHTWNGVTVENNHVVSLAMDSNNVTGSIPSEIAGLTEMVEFHMPANTIGGNIPPQLGLLSKLEILNLGDNQLQGEIPDELGLLVNLISLQLNSNNLTGSLPDDFQNLVNLQFFWAFENALTGQLPSSWASMVSIKGINLTDNGLGGPLPGPWSNMSSLTDIWLTNNAFSGSIPASWATIHSLKSLLLGNNLLDGEIPTGFGSTLLENLWLDNNNITGSIPADITTLPTFYNLILSNNQMSGELPAGLGSLPNLYHLKLGMNAFEGNIPEDLSQSQTLSILWIDKTGMGGEIPASTVNLTDLFDGSSQFDFCSFYTEDPDIQAFWDIKQKGDWKVTQTVAPKNLSGNRTTPSSMTLSWQKIPFCSTPGGYEVFNALSTEGPWSPAGSTSTKNEESLVIEGLTPATSYFFKARTRSDPHQDNTNTQISAFSEIVSVIGAPYISDQVPLSTPDETPITLQFNDLIVSDPDDVYPLGFIMEIDTGHDYVVNGTTVTPDPGFVGELSVPIRVSNGIVSNTFPVVITVIHYNEIPLISGQAPLATDEDASISLSLSNILVTDPDNSYPEDFTLVIESGLNFSLSGLTITPDSNWFGTLYVPIYVNDGEDDSAVFQLEVEVISVNDVPLITGQQALSVPEETSLALSLSDLFVDDPDNQYPSDFSLTVYSGDHFSLNGSSITPDPEFNGVIQVPVTVFDGNDHSEVFELTVLVTPVNDVPIITGHSQIWVVASQSVTLVLTDFSVSDGDSIFPDDFALTVYDGNGYTRIGNTIYPDQGQIGQLEVKVTVSDGHDNSPDFMAAIDMVDIVHFVDPNLRNWMVAQPSIDTLDDDVISLHEAATVTHLDISGLGLTRLDGLESFSNLEALDAHNNLLAELPNLSMLVTLKTLDLSKNQLGSLSAEGISLIPGGLTQLRLAENHLIVLPDEPNLYESLEWLDLSHNGLQRFPDTWPLIASLEVLDLANNHLGWLPGGVFFSDLLATIDCSNNRLREIPEVAHCLQLVTLKLKGNLLDELPGLQTLNSLSQFDFSQNRLMDIESLASHPFLGTHPEDEVRLVRNLLDGSSCGGLAVLEARCSNSGALLTYEIQGNFTMTWEELPNWASQGGLLLIWIQEISNADFESVLTCP